MILKKYQTIINCGNISEEFSEEHMTTILLKIVINYSKLMSFLLSLQNIIDLNLGIGNFFEAFTFVSQILSQISPSSDCIFLSFFLFKAS